MVVLQHIPRRISLYLELSADDTWKFSSGRGSRCGSSSARRNSPQQCELDVPATKPGYEVGANRCTVSKSLRGRKGHCGYSESRCEPPCKAHCWSSGGFDRAHSTWWPITHSSTPSPNDGCSKQSWGSRHWTARQDRGPRTQAASRHSQCAEDRHGRIKDSKKEVKKEPQERPKPELRSQKEEEVKVQAQKLNLFQLLFGPDEFQQQLCEVEGQGKSRDVSAVDMGKVDTKKFRKRSDLLIFAAKHPGALTANFINALRQKLMKGGILRTSQLRDIELTEFVTTGAAGLKEVRDRREATTLLQAMDHINQHELEKAMDVLSMRLTALLEAKGPGGSWEKASRKDLIPEENAGVAPAGLAGMT